MSVLQKNQEREADDLKPVNVKIVTIKLQGGGPTTKEISTKHHNFHLNNPDLFNPDTDSEVLATKCFDWLLNPFKIKDF
jgi:hypothetical protein